MMLVPIQWASGDPAWTRGRRVTVIAVYPGGGVLARTADGTRLLVRRCDLELVPLPAPREITYVGDARVEVRR